MSECAPHNLSAGEHDWWHGQCPRCGEVCKHRKTVETISGWHKCLDCKSYPVAAASNRIGPQDGGQNHWVDYPVKTVMAWMRGEVASSDDRPCICERGKENPDCPHSAHKRSEVQK